MPNSLSEVGSDPSVTWAISSGPTALVLYVLIISSESTVSSDTWA